MRCIRQKVCAFLMKFVFVQYLLWPSLQFSTTCAIVLAGLLLFNCPSCSLSLSLSHLGFCLVLPGGALGWLLLLVLPAGGALLGSRFSRHTCFPSAQYLAVFKDPLEPPFFARLLLPPPWCEMPCSKGGWGLFSGTFKPAKINASNHSTEADHLLQESVNITCLLLKCLPTFHCSSSRVL